MKSPAVAVQRNGAEEIFSGDIVVSSCGAINSAALLLRSATDRHPNGLANGSGVVGRHYMGHVNSVLLAISKSPNATVFQKTLGVNDFYFGDDEFKYPMGHISFVGKLDAIALSAGAPAIVPGMTLDIMAKHSLDFWLTSEDLPDPDNRVTLDRDGNIVLSYTPNNDEGHKRLIKKLEHLLQHLDMHPHLVPRNLFVGNRIPLAGVAHQNGTVRFGRDPKTSALDANCKAHDVDNLYVVDGSFFPSSGAVNPALTIMANALRVGDHILERLGARAAVSMEVRMTSQQPRPARSERSARPRLLRRRCSVASGRHRRAVRRRPMAARRCRSRPSMPSASPSSDMDRALAFYTRRAAVLEGVGPSNCRGARTSCSPGVFGARSRVVTLAAGLGRDRADRVPGAEGPADAAGHPRQRSPLPAHRDRRQRHRRRRTTGCESTASSTRPPDRNACRTGTRTPAASARSISAIPIGTFSRSSRFRPAKGMPRWHETDAAAVPRASTTPRSSSTTPTHRCASIATRSACRLPAKARTTTSSRSI